MHFSLCERQVKGIEKFEFLNTISGLFLLVPWCFYAVFIPLCVVVVWRGLARIMMEHVVNKEEYIHFIKMTWPKKYLRHFAANPAWCYKLRILPFSLASSRSHEKSSSKAWIIYEKFRKYKMRLDGKISQFSTRGEREHITSICRILSWTMLTTFLTLASRCEFLMALLKQCSSGLATIKRELPRWTTT